MQLTQISYVLLSFHLNVFREIVIYVQTKVTSDYIVYSGVAPSFACRLFVVVARLQHDFISSIVTLNICYNQF